jgi:hypothetical protein
MKEVACHECGGLAALDLEVTLGQLGGWHVTSHYTGQLSLVNSLPKPLRGPTSMGGGGPRGLEKSTSLS